MANARDAEPSRQGYRVILRRPDPTLGNFVLKTEPFGAWRTVPVPIQAGVVGEDLDARPDDQEDEEQVKEMLPPQPGRKPGVVHRLGAWAGIVRNELLYGRIVLPQILGQGDADNQAGGPKRDYPKHIVPPLPKADARHLTPLRWQPLAQANTIF